MDKRNPPPNRKADRMGEEPMWLIIFVSFLTSLLANLWLRGFS